MEPTKELEFGFTSASKKQLTPSPQALAKVSNVVATTNQKPEKLKDKKQSKQLRIKDEREVNMTRQNPESGESKTNDQRCHRFFNWDQTKSQNTLLLNELQNRFQTIKISSLGSHGNFSCYRSFDQGFIMLINYR